jgi:hypothetical protein
MATAINVPCSQIINRARGLADVVGSNFDTWNDLTQSLNEAWKDLYEVITTSSDAYFVTLTLLSAQGQAATVPLNPNEYFVPLPADFYKLEFLDYNYNGYWQPIRRFSKDNRNNYAGFLNYRFLGPNLWLVGAVWNGTSLVVRCAYYPAPDLLYFPNLSSQFQTGLNDLAKTSFQYIAYVPGPIPTAYPQDVNPQNLTYNSALIVQQGTGILLVSNNTNAVITIVTSAAAISQVCYYKGNVFWIQAGSIYGANFDPANPTTVTPVQLTVSTSVTYLDVNNSLIFYVDSTVAKTAAIPSPLATITGSSITTPFTPPASIQFYGYVNNTAVWLTAAGGIVVGNTAVTLLTGTVVTQLSSDGTYLYCTVQNTITGGRPYTLYRLTLSFSGTIATVSKQEVISTDVYSFGDPLSGWIPVINSEALTQTLYSTTPDYVFTYPNNLVTELLAYQVAMNVKMKQGATEDYNNLKERYGMLMSRYMEEVRRDDYYPERISMNNISAGPNGIFGVSG